MLTSSGIIILDQYIIKADADWYTIHDYIYSMKISYIFMAWVDFPVNQDKINEDLTGSISRDTMDLIGDWTHRLHANPW